MDRGLMVLVALAASLAQAQEATSEQRPMLLASRLAPQTSAEPLALKGGSRDGGADAGSAAGEGTSDKLADCPVFEGVLSGHILAVRSYSPPPPQSMKGWNERNTPYVAAAIRCGRRYVLQIMSHSAVPWVIHQARLEGPNGEVLKVQRLGFEKAEGDLDINGIVADAPPGVDVASLKLNLTGADGRVAQLEVRGLP